ncbi:MAG: UDP-N-acetylglucosamine 2-epimerase [Sumerlaeia bacterium]
MIHVVIGTKAQLIKMGPLMDLLEREGMPWNFIFTGQHHETIRDLRENFNVRDPDVILHEGKDIKSIPAMALWIVKVLFQSLRQRRRIFQEDRKGIVLVHGDTFSCLLGALLGRLHSHRVAHVESGLRSFDLFHPFPEEFVRILTFYLAHIYYCPGSWAVENLRKFRGEKIDTLANTLLDSLRLAKEKESAIEIALPNEPFCVFSTHRFENVFRTETLIRIVEIAELIAERLPLLFILHPPTRRQLEKRGLMERLSRNPNIELRPRYDYFSFIKLVSKSEFLATDGGSNQEECHYLGKPCLLLRMRTERREGLGETAVLSEFDGEKIDAFLRIYTALKPAPNRDLLFPSRAILDDLKRRLANPPSIPESAARIAPDVASR